MDDSTRTQAPTESYCVRCDAAVGDCACGGARYLSDTVYERTERDWKVRDEERAVWDAMRDRVWKVEPVHRSRPLEELIAECDTWIFMSNETVAQLTDLHGRNPERSTRLVEALIEASASGRLNVPDAWFKKKLREEQDDRASRKNSA